MEKNNEQQQMGQRPMNNGQQQMGQRSINNRQQQMGQRSMNNRQQPMGQRPMNNNQQQMGQMSQNNSQQQMGQRSMNNSQQQMGQRQIKQKSIQNTNKKGNGKTLGILGLVVAQLLTIVASITLYLFANFETMITMSCIAGIVVVDLVITIVIVTATFKDEEEQEDIKLKDIKKNEVPVNDFGLEKKVVNEPVKAQSAQQQPKISTQQQSNVIQKNNIAIENIEVYEETTLLSSDNNIDETTLLENVEEANKVLGYLKSKDDDEKVIINKIEFTLGRMKTSVDYTIANQAVGKQHAQIIYNDNKFYIKDLQSKNGTYVNKKRINTDQLCEIKENDVIVLANSEYVFTLA